MKYIHKGQHLGLGEAKCFCALTNRDGQEDKQNKGLQKHTSVHAGAKT